MHPLNWGCGYRKEEGATPSVFLWLALPQETEWMGYYIFQFWPVESHRLGSPIVNLMLSKCFHDASLKIFVIVFFQDLSVFDGIPIGFTGLSPFLPRCIFFNQTPRINDGDLVYSDGRCAGRKEGCLMFVMWLPLLPSRRIRLRLRHAIQRFRFLAC